jgi:hypothetical protein
MRLILIFTLIPLLSYSQSTKSKTIFEKKGTMVELSLIDDGTYIYNSFTYRYQNMTYQTFVDLGGFSFVCKSELIQFRDDVEYMSKSQEDQEILTRNRYWIAKSKDQPNQISIYDKYDRYTVLYGRMIPATIRDISKSIELWSSDRDYCN